MSVQLEKTNRVATRSRARRPLGAAAAPGVPKAPAALAGVGLASGRLDIVFEVILALAACLSLVIVVHEAVSDSADDSGAVSGQGMSDPPPAVFVQND